MPRLARRHHSASPRDERVLEALAEGQGSVADHFQTKVAYLAPIGIDGRPYPGQGMLTPTTLKRLLRA